LPKYSKIKKLREEFIESRILHEFACRCAERALSLIENPDPRSFAAIEAKRAWLRNEIDCNQLAAARAAAWDAYIEILRELLEKQEMW